MIQTRQVLEKSPAQDPSRIFPGEQNGHRQLRHSSVMTDGAYVVLQTISDSQSGHGSEVLMSQHKNYIIDYSLVRVYIN